MYVKGPEEKKTHYLKLITLESRFWKEHILFRDYLLNYTDWAEKYKKLKQALLEKYQDARKQYTKGKEDFIKEVIGLAIMEF